MRAKAQPPLPQRQNQPPKPKLVTSVKSPVIRAFRALHTAKGRKKEGAYWAEGTKLLTRALDFGANLQMVLATEEWLTDPAHRPLLLRLAQTPLVQVSSGILNKLSQTKPTPACLFIVALRTSPLTSVLHNAKLVLMTERVINIDNLGMMLRSAEASGVSGVTLDADTADPYHQRVVRASCGATFHLPLSRGHHIQHQIQAAQDAGLQVIATSANEGEILHQLDLSRPTAILVGNEQIGLTQEAKDAADTIAQLPMMGSINSLNVTVAASIALYETLRQQRPGK